MREIETLSIQKLKVFYEQMQRNYSLTISAVKPYPSPAHLAWQDFCFNPSEEARDCSLERPVQFIIQAHFPPEAIKMIRTSSLALLLMVLMFFQTHRPYGGVVPSVEPLVRFKVIFLLSES